MKPALSVSIRDCVVQTFRSGGKGGQHQNKTNSGVRVIHEPSGARGESREERSQLQNKRIAFRRMAESAAFKVWVNRTFADDAKIEAKADRDMEPDKLRIERRQNGRWEPWE